MTAVVEREDQHPHGPLRSPGVDGGLLSVFRRRYLLKLMVGKELKSRYQATLLGLGWSYIKPATKFLVYFLVMGVGLKQNDSVPNFPLHIFAGLVIVHLISETMTAGTKSIVSNRNLVRKMNVPREMLPVTSLMVSTYHTLPQYAMLTVACVVVGWSVTPAAVVAGLLGLAIILVMALAYALAASALNVFYRDFGSFSETVAMIVTWSVPMIYPWSRVADLGTTVSIVYQFNPIATAVMLTQEMFWQPTVGGSTEGYLPEHLMRTGWITLGVCLVLLYAAARFFRRVEARFAEFI